MADLREGLFAIVEEMNPISVRSVFYQASVRGLVEKTDAQIRAVGRMLKNLRLDGTIPFHYIVDSTRWMRKPASYDSLEAALKETASLYRRDVWGALDLYVEVWVEKHGLAGVLYDVTSEFDVPLMAAAGFSSITFLYSSAEAIVATGKPTRIYYFGDHDPSGKDIARNVRERLVQFIGEIERQPSNAVALGLVDDFEFEFVAVTPEQIREWNLPTRPTKETDSRAKNWKGDSVELDAIPPDKLRDLVRDCIEQHIPAGYLESLRRTEESESAILETMRFPSPTRPTKKKAKRRQRKKA